MITANIGQVIERVGVPADKKVQLIRQLIMANRTTKAATRKEVESILAQSGLSVEMCDKLLAELCPIAEIEQEQKQKELQQEPPQKKTGDRDFL